MIRWKLQQKWLDSHKPVSGKPGAVHRGFGDEVFHPRHPRGHPAPPPISVVQTTSSICSAGALPSVFD